jgi:tetratricopeptide (TPR) repeat protein
LVVGDLPRAALATERALAWALGVGNAQTVQFNQANLVSLRYQLGDWSGAAELIDELLRAGVQRSQVWGVRAQMVAARGEGAVAMDCVRRAVDLSRATGEAQFIWGSLIEYAQIARRVGLPDESRAALAEVVAAFAESETVGDAQDEHVNLIHELAAHGCYAEAREVLARMPPSRWTDVCSSVLEGDFEAAADNLDEMGEQSRQAELRLSAARGLASEGRLAEAEKQLEPARAFWQSVGATAYLRDADELVAAAS